MEVKRLSTSCWRRVLQRAFSFINGQSVAKSFDNVSDFSDIRPRRGLNTVGWLLFDLRSAADDGILNGLS